MTRFTSLASIGGALARVSVGVVVVVKCVAATKQRLHSRCLECPLDCGGLVGSCSADGVRHRQRGSLRASLERLDRAIDTEARLRRLEAKVRGANCSLYSSSFPMHPRLHWRQKHSAIQIDDCARHERVANFCVGFSYNGYLVFTRIGSGSG